MQHINNKAEFEQLIKENNNVVIDFYATWCGPCKMLAPIIEQVANEVSHVKIVKVDVDESEDLAHKFGIMSIPTLILFVNGKMYEKHIGLWQKEDLLELLNSF